MCRLHRLVVSQAAPAESNKRLASERSMPQPYICCQVPLASILVQECPLQYSEGRTKCFWAWEHLTVFT